MTGQLHLFDNQVTPLHELARLERLAALSQGLVEDGLRCCHGCGEGFPEHRDDLIFISDNHTYCAECYGALMGYEVAECHECDAKIVLDPDKEGMVDDQDPHRWYALEVYDSPWDVNPRTIYVHADNEESWRDEKGKLFGYGSCEERLFDTSWADWRYFNCPDCGRTIIRQCPSNGWHGYTRFHPEDPEGCEGEICLKCYEEYILEHGCSRDEMGDGKIPGMFLDRYDLEQAGFEKVEGFEGVLIRGTSDSDSESYCAKALELMDDGFVVVNDYDRMAIGGLEGYVTMWARKAVAKAA